MKFSVLLCRGCLSPLHKGADAGLCAVCWEGLLPLPEGRCPRCALLHDSDADCPRPTAWTHGDALWDYHGGRPAFGALLVPGIKTGEMGWRRALLRRLDDATLPEWVADVDRVTCAPTATLRHLWRGFDLAGDVAAHIATRIGRPFARTLHKTWTSGRQMARTESERLRLPKKALRLKRGEDLQGKTVLLMDDVWTTGTTLLRSAQHLLEGGARAVRVLTLFRSMQG